MCKLFKGFIFITIVIISIFFINKVEASDAYFVWEKTVIDVPVNSSLESFKDDYIVKLFVNGNESSDFYVEYETNCSTFTTVITSKVGRYTVYYKAYSKANYVSSEQAIVFNVIDNKPPVITLLEDVVEVEVGKSLLDYYWYDVKDDNCETSEIKINLNDQSVVYTSLGLYNASISAIDSFGNVENVDFKVKVVDKTPPVITIVKPLVFEYLEIVNICDYILCVDNSDGDITKFAKVSNLDTKVLGRQTIMVEVSDFSNNKAIMTFEVLIVDETPPIINLILNEITLDIRDFSLYTPEYFNQYVYSVNDNYTLKENIELKIDTTNLVLKVADFFVNYTAVDENNNRCTEKLLVKLREFVGPTITGVEELDILVGENVDLLSLVSVYDEYDVTASTRLLVEENGFNSDKEGTYKVKYVCFNNSGIYTEKIITINVYNLQKTTDNNNAIIVVLSISLTLILIGSGVTILYIKKKK